MKKQYRIISFFLIIVILLSTLAACDSGSKENDTTDIDTSGELNTNDTASSETDQETEYMPNIAKNTYDTDFFLSIMPTASFMEYN